MFEFSMLALIVDNFWLESCIRLILEAIDLESNVDKKKSFLHLGYCPFTLMENGIKPKMAISFLLLAHILKNIDYIYLYSKCRKKSCKECILDLCHLMADETTN